MTQGFLKTSIISTIEEDIEIQNLTTEPVEFYDIERKQDIFNQIISIDETITDTLVYFRTDIAKEFSSAPNTLFYVENKSKFVKSSELEIGDKLVCPTGDSIEYIVLIETYPPKNEFEKSMALIQHLNGPEMGYFINGVLVKNN